MPFLAALAKLSKGNYLSPSLGKKQKRSIQSFQDHQCQDLL